MEQNDGCGAQRGGAQGRRGPVGESEEESRGVETEAREVKRLLAVRVGARCRLSNDQAGWAGRIGAPQKGGSAEEEPFTAQNGFFKPAESVALCQLTLSPAVSACNHTEFTVVRLQAGQNRIFAPLPE